MRCRRRATGSRGCAPCGLPRRRGYVAGRALCGACYNDNPVTGISQQLLPVFGILGREPFVALIQGLGQPLEEPGEVVLGEELPKNELSSSYDAAYLLVNRGQLHE